MTTHETLLGVRAALEATLAAGNGFFPGSELAQIAECLPGDSAVHADLLAQLPLVASGDRRYPIGMETKSFRQSANFGREISLGGSLQSANASMNVFTMAFTLSGRGSIRHLQTDSTAWYRTPGVANDIAE